MNYKSIALILTGMALGCAATVAHERTVKVASAAGEWRCYVADRFPSVEDAASYGGAEDTTAGLNQTAQHAPAGTVFSLAWKPGTPIVCVKY